MNEKWFALSVEQIEKKLKTNAASGLSRKAARSRSRKDYGDIFYFRKKRAGEILIELFADISLAILIISALCAVAFDGVALGAISLILVAVNITLTFIYYFRQERSLEAMNGYFLPTVKTIRGGRLYNLDHKSLVVGDVIILERGDIVCCDARIVTSEALKVTMKLDAEKYVELEKHAEGNIYGNSNRAENQTNMLHAGSVIENGNARAIVVATGKYTYISALTGGEEVSREDKIPSELIKIKKTSSTVGFIALITVLPFCLISMIFARLTGGNATLAVSFITVMALSATTVSRVCFSLAKTFYITKIKKLSVSRSPLVLRSLSAVDRLVGVKYLFLLDGSPLTDGKLHCESALCGNGRYLIDGKNRADNFLCELSTLYYNGCSTMLSTGVSSPDRMLMPVREFLIRQKCDIDALKIRCRIVSCHSENGINGTDRIIFVDRGVTYVLSVSRKADIIDRCSYCYGESGKQEFQYASKQELMRECYEAQKRGKEYLVFSVSTMESNDSDTERCLGGIIFFSEGVDERNAQIIKNIESEGVKVIRFVDCPDSPKVPPIPKSTLGERSLSVSQLMSHNLPVTFDFGKADNYFGFSEKDILSLLRYAHGRHERVAVIGFSDHAIGVLEEADVFICCSEITGRASTKIVADVNETRGDVASASCVQAIKLESDCIITRPSKRSGGLEGVERGLVEIKKIYENLERFLSYVLSVAFLRIFIVGLPMLFGQAFLDARHVLLVGVFFDLAAMLIFAYDSSDMSLKKHIKERYQRTESIGNKNFIIPLAISSLICVILPYGLEYIGFFGIYLYKTEYMLITLLVSHMAVLVRILSRDGRGLLTILKNKVLCVLIGFFVLFVVAVAVFDSFGMLFGIERFAPQYFIVSLILPWSYILLDMIFRGIFKRE